MVFESHSHQRFEGGLPKQGIQTCNRTIKIEKNINGCKGYQLTPGDGFIVSIINMDGNHPLWGDNYQISPKPMRVIDQSTSHISLRGYEVLAQTPKQINYNETMKTKKFFMLLAAMLLSCASAFAQSGNNTPAKGDVNEDGTVDVADIVNVIKIMKDGGGAVGEKMCYWYAGTNNGNVVQADNLTDVASRIAESEVPETGSVTANGQYVYFVMPETKHIKSLTDGNGSAVEFTLTDVMGYKIYKTNNKISGSINFVVAQTVYYWYVGSTQPVSSSDVTSSGWTKLNSKPSQIDVNTDMVIPPVVWYVAIPHEYGFQPYESSGAVPDSGSWTKSQVTIQNVSYDVFTLNGSAPRVNAIYKV